jgi:4-hydroxythreonine-4-phosphate dehydrogenase
MNAATIVVTIGEPAGIGPDLAVRLAERNWPARLVLAGDCELLRERARRLGAGVRLVPYLRGRAATPGALEVAHFPVAVPVQAGRLDAANARTVIASLDAALAGCLSGEFAAMVTAPVQKSVINDAGIQFTGHTEFLAQRTGAPASSCCWSARRHGGRCASHSRPRICRSPPSLRRSRAKR